MGLDLLLGWIRDRWRYERDPESLAFDRDRGVETARWTFDYEPVPPDLARAALAAVPFPPTGCTFLDLGCGKGRALLLAAERPFARVLGVERSPSLVRRCRRNIASARRADLTALDPEVIEGDVWDVPLPCGDLVLFLYNPFGAELVGDVLRRARSVDRRNLALVYVNPQEEDTVIAIGWRRAAAGGSDSGTERWAVYLPVS